MEVKQEVPNIIIVSATKQVRIKYSFWASIYNVVEILIFSWIQKKTWLQFPIGQFFYFSIDSL